MKSSSMDVTKTMLALPCGLKDRSTQISREEGGMEVHKNGTRPGHGSLTAFTHPSQVKHGPGPGCAGMPDS